MSFCSQLSLINPAVSLIFAGCFLVVWRQLRSQHLLAFGVSFVCYAVAVAIQVLSPPSDSVWTTLVAAPFYISSALLLVCGLLWRAHVKSTTALAMCAGVAVVEFALLAYFHFAVPDLATRIYVHNFGAALIFVIALAHLGRLRRGSMADRAIYWVFVAFTLNVALRTLLSTGSPADAEACGRTSPATGRTSRSARRSSTSSSVWCCWARRSTR